MSIWVIKGCSGGEEDLERRGEQRKKKHYESKGELAVRGRGRRGQSENPKQEGLPIWGKGGEKATDIET